jgi:hypothetical protein
MERNILLGIVILLVLIIGYKLYNKVNLNKLPENYNNIVQSEFSTIEKEKKNIYEKYLDFIVDIIPDTSNKASTISSIKTKIYEYIDNISYAPSLLPSPSPSTTPYPYDTNLIYIIFIIFPIVLLVVFIIIKKNAIYKWIIDLPNNIRKIMERFSSKKPSSNSLLESSDMSTTESL